jgi:DNA primase
MSLWVDYKAVKEKVSIEAVLRHYRLLENFNRKGDQLAGPCPVHKGSNKRQFSVNVSKGAWKCFSGHCGKSGNVIDLVAAVENVPFRDAAIMLQDWFRIEPNPSAQSVQTPAEKEKEGTPGATLDTTAEKQEAPAEPSSAPADEVTNKPLTFELQLDPKHPYLESRGLTPETIAHFGLGLASRGSMKGRLAIAIHNDKGELVAYAGRWAGPDDQILDGEGKYKLPPGFHKSLVVYNLHRVMNLKPAAKSVILVEGYFSVFWLHQNGFPHVVSLMGSSLSLEQRQLLGERFKGIQVFFDGDEAGETAATKIAGELARTGWVKIIRCPSGAQPDQLPAADLKQLLR